MADTFTTTTGNWSPLVQTAFDTSVAWYLNDMVFFRSLVDKHPVAQAMPGVTVTLTILGQLPVNSTPLTENLDVDAQAMPAPRQVSVTLAEYGNAVTTTAKLEKTAFTGTVVSDVSKEVATNMVESLDPVYRTLLDNAANKIYIHTNGTIQTADPTAANTGNFTAKLAAVPPALLRGRKAPTRDGLNYTAWIHPDVSFDLRTEAGSAWTAAHTQVDTGEVYRGEIGTFQGCRYIETPRCLKSGSPARYNTYYLGTEGLVELVGTEPAPRIGPIVDKLSRFRPLGWYAMLGANRYRENCIQVVTTQSSISALAGAYDPKA